MKKKIVILVCILFSGLAGFTQIGVNIDGSQPDNSAMLDVKSTTRGLLVPRMTIAERDLIANPAKGLLVFCTNDNQYYMQRGLPAYPIWKVMNSQWISNGSNIYYDAGNIGIGETNPAYPLNFGYDLGSKISLHGAGLTHYGFGVQDYRMQIFSDQLYSDITFGYGSSTAFTETFRIKGTGTVGIGTSTPNNSALVDMASTTKGFLPPRMNTTQMYQLGTTAPEGMTVYNTTTKCLCVYNGWKWICNNDGESCGDVLYYGQTYNTVVIGNQCWFKQNLNRGDKIDGATSQTNNGIIEKYCYNNNETNCGIYGGLYQWNEMMNYAASSNANPSGVQGICPTGWHIPSDEEFCKAWYRLDPTVGSCSNTGPIGTDIGSKLKEAGTTHWMGPNTNTNTSGFSALGAGMSAPGGYFYNSLHNTYYWTSREYESNTNQAWGRSLSYNQSDGNRADDAKYYGKSVRCVKD